MITHRDYYIRCMWWKTDKETDELTYNENPSGIFFAKESQLTNKSDQNDNGIIDIDSQTTVIQTVDDVSEIHHKDIVEYLGQKWIVENIQSKIYTRRSQYNTRPDRIWWLTLRNGE